MRWQKIIAIVVPLMLLLPELNAQFVPVIANVRRTRDILSKGEVVARQTKEGFYYRSSDGSVLERYIKVNGDERLGQIGGLRDNKQGVGYQLDFKSKIAYRMPKMGEVGVPGVLKKDDSPNLKHDSVEGVRCTVFPTYERERDGKTVSIGQSCWSVDDDLLLKEDTTIPWVDGQTAHTTYELYNIQLNKEPDAGLFDVQRNFTVKDMKNTPK